MKLESGEKVGTWGMLFIGLAPIYFISKKGDKYNFLWSWLSSVYYHYHFFNAGCNFNTRNLTHRNHRRI